MLQVLYHNLRFRLRILPLLLLIAAQQGGFIVMYLWEVVVRKNLTIFEDFHFEFQFGLMLFQCC